MYKRSKLFLEAVQKTFSANNPKPINVNRFKHKEIVDGLHTLIYNETYKEYHSKKFRICYNDGSESESFPILHLNTIPEINESISPLRLGFLSGRHAELDNIIDFYIMRNKEHKQFQSSAEVEQEIYDRTIRLFDDQIFDNPWRVEVYHTGLEPLTIGFYRAIVDLSFKRKRQTQPIIPIIPKIYFSGYVDLQRYFEESAKKLNNQEIETVLSEIEEKLPEFFEVVRENGVLTQFNWLLERPMFTSELDYLYTTWPNIKDVFDKLNNRNQYKTRKTWVL